LVSEVCKRYIDGILLVMGRRLSRRKWLLKPHADGPPAGLWWWRDLGPEERRRVLCVYLEKTVYIRTDRDDQYKGSVPDERWDNVCQDLLIRRKNLPEDFPALLEEIIQFTTTVHRDGWLTLEGAAVKFEQKRARVYYWFRKLDKIARELYPDKAPNAVYLTDETIETIRQEYVEKGNARELAERYRLAPCRLGQIVWAEKQWRRNLFEAERNAQQAAEPSKPQEDDTDEFLY
jgi:hypothetical protein